MLARPTSLQSCRKPALASSHLWGLLASLGSPGQQLQGSRPCLPHLSCVCLHLANFPGHSHPGLEAQLTSARLRLCYICRDPVSIRGHTLRCWGLGLQCSCWKGGTVPALMPRTQGAQAFPRGSPPASPALCEADGSPISQSPTLQPDHIPHRSAPAGCS